MMLRYKTRVVQLFTQTGNGDATVRSWWLSRRQEKRVHQLLREIIGEPGTVAIVPAEVAAKAHEVGQESGLIVMEAPPDLEAVAEDEIVAAPLRSLVGTITAGGDVEMFIIYGQVPRGRDPDRADGKVEVPMVPNGSVVIKGEEFGPWLDGMRQWWESSRP